MPGSRQRQHFKDVLVPLFPITIFFVRLIFQVSIPNAILEVILSCFLTGNLPMRVSKFVPKSCPWTPWEPGLCSWVTVSLEAVFDGWAAWENKASYPLPSSSSSPLLLSPFISFSPLPSLSLPIPSLPSSLLPFLFLTYPLLTLLFLSFPHLASPPFPSSSPPLCSSQPSHLFPPSLASYLWIIPGFTALFLGPCLAVLSL